ncbi:hypothetical protein PanWU01x14_240210 [Parasponia andersonii]|uniref:Uncharacterized protein n=1 Tax=Parasponia andersonii TaxID=3476 RepID=A0A2P5BGU7_PARAD|nr:hypothetical protein PanWU01x14_240210 [Parasponia andersonii]
MAGITHLASIKETITCGCSFMVSVSLTIPENEPTIVVKGRWTIKVLNQVSRLDHDTMAIPEAHISHPMWDPCGMVSEPVPESMVSGDAEPFEEGRIPQGSHIGWKGERSTLDKGVDTFP